MVFESFVTNFKIKFENHKVYTCLLLKRFYVEKTLWRLFIYLFIFLSLLIFFEKIDYKTYFQTLFGWISNISQWLILWSKIKPLTMGYGSYHHIFKKWIVTIIIFVIFEKNFKLIFLKKFKLIFKRPFLTLVNPFSWWLRVWDYGHFKASNGCH